MNEIRHLFSQNRAEIPLIIRITGHSSGGFGFGVELVECARPELVPQTSKDTRSLTFLGGFDYFNPAEGSTPLFGVGGKVVERTTDKVPVDGPPYLEYEGGDGLLIEATTPEARLMLNFLAVHAITEDDLILRRLEDGTFDITLAICKMCGHGIRHPEAAVRAKKCSLCLYDEWKQQFVPQPSPPEESEEKTPLLP